MRVSCRKDDPGYLPHAFTRGLRVLVDGVERTHVVTADEEKRFVLRWVTPLRKTAAGDEMQSEELHGDVVVLTPPGWADPRRARMRQAVAANHRRPTGAEDGGR